MTHILSQEEIDALLDDVEATTFKYISDILDRKIKILVKK